MGRYLLDTHTFLWALSQPLLLGEEASLALKHPQHQLFLSVASLWEVSIKVSLGKLSLSDDWPETFRKACYHYKINTLPITLDHCATLQSLEFIHRDPFDRMLIAQAIKEKLVILTKDQHIQQYSVECVW